MIVTKNFPFTRLLAISWYHILWLTVWGAVAVATYQYTSFHWLAIPWLPVSLVGTVLAFYQGFKNNSSYDRTWEARKIWGAIVNTSRSWATAIKHFVTNIHRMDPITDTELRAIHRRIIYRHVAWLYTLREQLLKPTPWEHSQTRTTRRITEQRIQALYQGFNFADHKEILSTFLAPQEAQQITSYQNAATQLLDHQSEELRTLREESLIDDFRHTNLQRMITELYTHQGKCERIKNFPFPRQYGSMSFYFVGIFLFLLPFGMLSQFEQLGEGLIWLTVPFTTLVGWVFLMMELVGDYSENPFERLANDTPMYALCRTIEIDLREMLGETELPPKVVPVNGMLM